MIERLILEIKRKKNPCIIGLDPQWDKIPGCYKTGKEKSDVIWDWSRDIIAAVSETVVAIKPQIAFYEQYGSKGIEVFERVVSFAHEKGLLVIDDCKRNDIENTAEAYAFAHLDKDGPINADFMTVNPFLGMDSIEPYIRTAKRNGKGIFVLVRTSNEGAKDYQDAKTEQNLTVSEKIAKDLTIISQKILYESDYSPIGAVVGATYPEDAKKIRSIMNKSFLLVPGFGAQGGSIETCMSCFNEDGLGALINSSRRVLYAYREKDCFNGTKESYLTIVEKNCEAMRDEIYSALKARYQHMLY